MSPWQTHSALPPTTCALRVALRAEVGGARLAAAPVTPADLADLVSETWRDCVLRQGRPALPLDHLDFSVTPRFADSGRERCHHLAVEVTLPGGERRSRLFSIHSLAPAARRLSQTLVGQGLLAEGQSYCFEVLADPEAAAVHSQPGDVWRVSVRRAPLNYLLVPLAELCNRARLLGADPGAAPPVFYTRKALRRAEDCARQGAGENPPVESGGVLLGVLAACPRTGEMATIVTDVLELHDAEKAARSLACSGPTWDRVQTIMRARQQAYPIRAERLCGQCHGHNFLPHDEAACLHCEKQATCALTSVFVSAADEAWMRSVFVRQPWALCHIFGFSARREPAQTLFTLNDGRWQGRGFHLLEDFDPDQWPFQQASENP